LVYTTRWWNFRELGEFPVVVGKRGVSISISAGGPKLLNREGERKILEVRRTYPNRAGVRT